jgi:hypothetical protein
MLIEALNNKKKLWVINKKYYLKFLEFKNIQYSKYN